MNFLGNLIWLICGGLISALLWTLAALLLCVTIVGIPFGFQCFKIAQLVLWPFGKQIELGNFGVGGLLLNILWVIFLGWELAVAHICIGILLCVTIIGIPFGLQHFKFAKLGFVPFGAQIY